MQAKTEGVSGGRLMTRGKIRRAKACPVHLASGDSSQSGGVMGVETSSRWVEAGMGGEEMRSIGR